MKKEEIIESLLNGFSVPENTSKDEAWSRVEAEISTQRVSKTKVFSIKRAVPFIAAASVALAFLFFYPSSNTVEFSSVKGSSELIHLPDGSEVVLGPSSELKYSETSDERSVILSGEAFFEVEKGVPFMVSTDNVQVRVLGTSFNVNSRESSFDVKCFTGKVNVKAAEMDVDITKGQGVNMVDGDLVYQHSSKLKNDDLGLTFDRQYLNSVLNDLELYKGWRIKNKTDINPVINLELKDESVEEVVEIISSIVGLRVEKLEDSSFQLF